MRNQAAFRSARILLSDVNFGCGSSRENAVWALYSFGIHCVIALSFRGIFYQNCFKNRPLPIVLRPAKNARLARLVECAPAVLTVTVDLAHHCIVIPGEEPISFDIAQRKQRILLDGLDDITEKQNHGQRIDEFRQAQRTAMPWLYQTTEI